MRFQPFLILSAALYGLSGCSMLGVGDETSEPEGLSVEAASSVAERPLESFALLLVRNERGASRFEQYKVQGANLFQECGLVAGETFTASEQSLIELGSGDRETLESLVGEALSEVAEDSAHPDSSNRVVVSVKRQGEVPRERPFALAALDAADTDQARRVRALAEEMREIVDEAPCGEEAFFRPPPVTDE